MTVIAQVSQSVQIILAAMPFVALAGWALAMWLRERSRRRDAVGEAKDDA